MNYNKFFDHTCLKADATLDDIQKLCSEAKQYDFMRETIDTSPLKAIRLILWTNCLGPRRKKD